MREERFLVLMDETYNKLRELTHKKGHDYADPNGDHLLNFKQVSEICNTLQIHPAIDPIHCCLFYDLVKLQRFCNLYNQGVEPDNESLQDTLDDRILYLFLLKGLLAEQENE